MYCRRQDRRDTIRAAFYWQGGAFKAFNDLVDRKISEYRLDTDPPRAARVYAIVSVALYDSVVACWDAKYTYWAIRPNQLDATVTTVLGGYTRNDASSK